MRPLLSFKILRLNPPFAFFPLKLVSRVCVFYSPTFPFWGDPPLESGLHESDQPLPVQLPGCAPCAQAILTQQAVIKGY